MHGKLENESSLKTARCADDCITILKENNLFTPNDVRFIQSLFQKTECEELSTECVEYALAQKNLCFFEKPPGIFSFFL